MEGTVAQTGRIFYCPPDPSDAAPHRHLDNSFFDVGTMLVMGVVGYLFEANGFPVAPVVLGLVLGPIVEQNFMVSMIKTQWDLTQFFSRPASATLAILTILTWLAPVYPLLFRRAGRSASPALSPALVRQFRNV